jgi:hypothetical protein
MSLNKTKWTEEEKEFLKKHYDTSTMEEIALALNRSESGCHRIALKLGLRRLKPIVDGKKHCLICKEYKPFEDFGKAKNTKTGLFSYCRICASKKGKEDRFRDKLAKEKEEIEAYRENLPQYLRCSHCRKMLDKSEFNVYKTKNRKVRHNNNCRTCHNILCRHHTLEKERKNEYANANKRS